MQDLGFTISDAATPALVARAFATCCPLRRQVVESRAREQSVDEQDSGAVWVSALTLVDLAGRCCPYL